MQLDIFTAPYIRHSISSLEAAESIKPKRQPLQAQVLAYLKRRGGLGATDEECQIALGLNPSTQRPRRIELVEAGLIVEADFQRKTRSGRNASVWIAI